MTSLFSVVTPRVLFCLVFNWYQRYTCKYCRVQSIYMHGLFYCHIQQVQKQHKLPGPKNGYDYQFFFYLLISENTTIVFAVGDVYGVVLTDLR